MPKLIWETGRQFTVVRYVASHQQLLFRSSKGDGGSTRIDVLFAPVQYMSLQSSIYEIFNVYEIFRDEMQHYCSALKFSPPTSCKIFGIGDANIGGVVIASGFTSNEDDGEFWEPSAILRFDP